MQLTHRVLRVVQHLHLLIPALRSSSIRPEEEALRAALEEIDEEIRRPGGMGKMRAKLNELWALVDAVRAARERIRQEGTVEWAVVDEDGLAQIAQVHLLSVLRRNGAHFGLDFGGRAGRPCACDNHPAAGSQRPLHYPWSTQKTRGSGRAHGLCIRVAEQHDSVIGQLYNKFSADVWIRFAIYSSVLVLFALVSPTTLPSNGGSPPKAYRVHGGFKLGS